MVMKKFVKRTKRFAPVDRGKRRGQGTKGVETTSPVRDPKVVKRGSVASKGQPKGGKSTGCGKTKCNKPITDGSEDATANRDFQLPVNHCKVCTILSPEKQLFYAEAWTQGDIQSALPVPISGSKGGYTADPGRSAKLKKRLLTRYGITNADCEHHARVCIRVKEDSRYTKVASQFDQLWKALDLAHEVYMLDPSMFNANAYTALTRELRGCLMDLNKVQSSDEVAEEITATALNPMVKRMTTAIITEASRLKEDLLAKFSEEDADKVVNGFVERLAVQIQDTVPYCRDRIADALSARDKNRKKALAGKATLKRGSAQGMPHSDSETKGKLLSLPVG